MPTGARRVQDAAALGRVRQLSALVEVSRAVSATLDYREVVRSVLDTAQTLLPGCGCCLWELVPGTDELRVVEARGFTRQLPRSRLPLGDGPEGRVVQAREPLSLTNLLADERAQCKEWIAAEGLVSGIFLPLLQPGAVYGTLALFRRSRRQFAPDELQLLESFAALAGAAIANARLFSRSETRRRAAEAMAEVSRLLLATLDPAAVGQRIADSVLTLLGSEASGLYRLRPESDDLVAVAVSGRTGVTFRCGLVLPAGAGAIGLALRERRPVVSSNLQRDPRVTLTPELRSAMEEIGYGCVLAVPLMVQGRIIGGLAVGDRVGRTYDDEDVRLVQAFANQAALALQNAQLYEDATRQQREAEIIAELTQAINAALDLDTVLQRVTEVARELTASDAAAIALREPGSEALVMRFWVGSSTSPCTGLRVEAGRGLGGRVMATGRPCRTDDYVGDPALTGDYVDPVVRQEGLVSVMGAPIRIGERVEGVLYVANRARRPFTDRHEAVLVRLADPAATAIHNVHLFAREQAARGQAEASSVRFEELVQTLDAIVWEADPETWQLSFVSQRAETMLGYPVQRWLEPGFWVNILHPEDRSRVVARAREAIAAGRDHELEYRALAADGRVVWLRDAVHVVCESDGRPVRVRGLLVDVTERRRAEDELRRQREVVVQTERLAAMGQLRAGVAHELNNPLSVVIGHTALLRGAAGAGAIGTRAEKIGQAAERCARIVRNFLTLARQNPPDRQLTSLNQLVTEALEVVAYSLRVDDVEVVQALDPGLPPLSADPHQLNQVVINLLSNAHHAVRQSPPPRRLTLTTRRDPDRPRIWLEVADSGPGIPAEILTRIMEPFFTTKPPGQGTGLGLSICRGIVDAHGGSIQVLNLEPHGAVFRVELPLATRAASAGASPLPPGPAAVLGKRILVVDDEPEIAAVPTEMLVADQHRVDTVANGALALERLHRRAYDLILSDVRMPELDGPALFKEAERRHPGLSRRFVFVTGDTMSAETAAVLEATGAPRLSKPFALDEVRRVVQEVLGRA